MHSDLAKKIGSKNADDVVGIAEEMSNIEAMEKKWTEDRQELIQQIDAVKAQCAEL